MARARSIRPTGTALAVAAALAVALGGCSSDASSEVGPSVDQAALCESAAGQVVRAAEAVVASYAPGADEAGADDGLAEAVARSVDDRDRLGCDASAFRASIERGLAAIEPDGAIADAVWRRVSASVLGTGREEAGEWRLEAGDDLRDALARAGSDAVVVLPAGTWELDASLVLLDGVALRGAGAAETVLRSSAPEAAIVVATAGLVRLESLAIEHVGDAPASGLIGGPDASVVLTGVRIAGAVDGEAGEGGAGVLLTATGDEGSGRGTTLEVTDSAFEDNAWAGIAVAGGHQVSVESSTFARSGEVGMLFLDAAGGSVRGSAFTDNQVALAATGTAAPSWIGTTISGGGIGMQLDGSAAPRIEGTTISGTPSAVVFGGSSTGWIGGTACPGAEHGIVVADTAAPTLGEGECPVVRGLS